MIVPLVARVDLRNVREAREACSAECDGARVRFDLAREVPLAIDRG